jgi:hypothetical protein
MADITPWYEKYKVDVPEGNIGEWRIEHAVVTTEDENAGHMRSFNPSSMGRYVPAGTYTMLYNGGKLWMSDTPDEGRDHLEPIYEAKRRGGHVLINGLGIGMVANAVLSFENVTKVTIIEMSPEVIALVGPSLIKKYGSRCEIIEANSYEYKPPKGIRYSMVWHDIWLNLCTDNLKEMAKLHRKYGRRTDWQASWSKELLLRHRRQERNSGW